MSEERPTPGVLCHQCGAEIVSAAPEGLCPMCLVGMGLSLLGSQSGNREGKPEEPRPLSEPPRRFGDYELLNEIARGGMGVVYRARQISLNRIVAVKLLLFGRFASDAFVKRFRAEAEAAASLQHPNIVAVHEVGEHEGQHYFSMELVEGRSLAEFVREKPLPPREAAGHVRAIAEAIEYAHRHGVLHRDLKPSNVLIDAQGQPRVTDFGLAKRFGVPASAGRAGEISSGVESSRPEPAGTPNDLTLTGQMLGSPNYMPPEQAEPKRGPVSPASDVYSLGAIVYHLLTGRPPFLADTFEETLSQLLHRDPVAPRLLNPAIPRDLETICLRCLEKESARRYATSGQLADELGRFLCDEPILARPAGAAEKLRRWCRRQPALAGLSFALAVAVLGGLIATNILLWREKQASSRASAAELAQMELRVQAEAGKEVATIEANKSRQMAQFLQEMLMGVGPSAARGRDTTLLREMLDQTAKRLDRELTNQPAIAAELRDTIGGVYYDVGAYDQAVAMHREALRLRRQSLGDGHEDSARSKHRLAGALTEHGDLDEAEALNHEARATWEKLLGPDHPKIADSLNSLGTVWFRRGDPGNAQPFFEQALAIYRQHNDPHAATALHNLANTLTAQKDYARAENLYREAIAMARERDGATNTTTAFYVSNLGELMRRQNKLAEAGALQSEALAVRAVLLDEGHPLLSDSLEHVAQIKAQQRQWAEAEALYRKALAARRKKSPEDPRTWNESAGALADIFNRRKRFDETDGLMTELLATTSDTDARTLRLRTLRGTARARRGQWQAALPDLARVFDFDPTRHWNALLLAPLLVESGNGPAYNEFRRKCLSQFGETSNPDVAIRTAQACLLAPGSDADLAPTHKLIDLVLSLPGYRGSNHAVASKALADYRSGRAAQAVARLEDLLKNFADRKPQPGRFVLVQAHAVLAMARHSVGRRDEARTALDRALEVAPAVIAMPTDGDYGGNWHEWLMLHIHLGEARSLMEGSPGAIRDAVPPKP